MSFSGSPPVVWVLIVGLSLPDSRLIDESTFVTTVAGCIYVFFITFYYVFVLSDGASDCLTATPPADAADADAPMRELLLYYNLFPILYIYPSGKTVGGAGAADQLAVEVVDRSH